MKLAMGSMAGVALLLGSATGAGAFQAHYLRAQAANMFYVESTTDPGDFHVEAPPIQIGVPGVNDFLYHAFASADSASGSLYAENLIQWGPSANFSLTTSNSSASIEQVLEWQDGGGPITVTIQLSWVPAVDNASGGQAIATADLRVDSLCIVSATIRAGPAEDEFVTCETDYPFVDFVSSSGANRLSIRGTWAAGHVGEGLTFQASIGSSLVTGGGESSVFGSVVGGLSIQVGGAAGHHFGSPNFLSVPEPESGEVGVAGMLALFLLGKSRRKTPLSVGSRR